MPKETSTGPANTGQTDTISEAMKAANEIADADGSETSEAPEAMAMAEQRGYERGKTEGQAAAAARLAEIEEEHSAKLIATSESAFALGKAAGINEAAHATPTIVSAFGGDAFVDVPPGADVPDGSLAGKIRSRIEQIEELFALLKEAAGDIRGSVAAFENFKSRIAGALRRLDR